MTASRIKVSLLTPRRLLFELSKAGWEDADYSSGSDNDDSGTCSPAPLATSSTSLSILADNLLLAASQTRTQYLHPTITFILPHLPPTTPEVTAFLTSLQAKGISVHTPTTLLPAPSVTSLLDSLTAPLSRRATPLSSTLNLDTTILLALISDISHHPSVPQEPRFHPAILRQIEMEREKPMLPDQLLPVLAGRDLLCSSSARARFQEIVDIVASDTERARANILLVSLSDEPKDSPTPEERLAQMQALSTHPLTGLRLPVETVPDFHPTEEDPAEYRRVAMKLSVVNRGAFMTGWARELTTVTSNRAVAKVVEAACSVEESGESGEVMGPDVFVVDTARSLVGRARKIDV